VSVEERVQGGTGIGQYSVSAIGAGIRHLCCWKNRVVKELHHPEFQGVSGWLGVLAYQLENALSKVALNSTCCQCHIVFENSHQNK